MATATQTMPVPELRTPGIVTPTATPVNGAVPSARPRVEISQQGNKKIKVIVVADLVSIYTL